MSIHQKFRLNNVTVTVTAQWFRVTLNPRSIMPSSHHFFDKPRHPQPRSAASVLALCHNQGVSWLLERVSQGEVALKQSLAPQRPATLEGLNAA